MNIVDDALLLATLVHGDQKNKYGSEPYILHPMRVWMTVRDGGLGEFEQAAALLHDTLEDTNLSIGELERIGFPWEVINAIWLLTKNKGEDNRTYYERVQRNEIARVVKLADINDNFRRNHLIEDEGTRLRMARKYSLGLDILS